MGADLLTGWLMAAIAYGALPAGSLVLLMMMRLIPGAWGETLRLSAEAATLTLPGATLAFLPILIGMKLLYPWMRTAPDNEFQRFWLSPVTWIACTIVWFAALWLLASAMRRRRSTGANAEIGLVLLPPLALLVANLWLLSLYADFHSSIFGLQFLLAQVTIAFTVLVLLRLTLRRRPPRLDVLGGMLLTLALLGAYFEYMPFFIAWSGNLPTNAAWYLARGRDGWPVACWIFALLGSWPIFAMFFARARSAPGWLLAVAASMLAGKLVELGWMILPGHGATGVVAAATATPALGFLAALDLRRGLGQRIRKRMVRP